MEAGDVIDGRYLLDSAIGSGAFGVVWRATVLATGEAVAIKLLKSPGVDSLQRFDREARALARITHPNTTAIVASGTAPEGLHYLAMELADGVALSESRGRHRSVDDIVELLQQISAALAAAHAEGVAHRDLKPENIVVESQTGHIKVLDFGLAKLYGLDQIDVTKTGEVFGTPQYMSPEQLRGSREAGPRADIYALGVIAFELLEGRLPFSGPTMLELAMAHISKPPPPLSRADATPRLRALVAAMLQKEPDARPTAPMVLKELGRLDDPKPAPKTTAVVPGRSQRSWGIVAAVAVGVVIVVVAIWVWGARPSLEIEPEPTASQRDISSLVAPAAPDPERGDRELASGCGRAWKPGVHEPSVGPTLEPRAFYLYLPKNYAPEKRHPVMLLFHRTTISGYYTAEDLVRDLDARSLADQHGLILIGPQSSRDWRRGSGQAQHIQDILAWTHDHLCVDHARRYAFGYTTGGDFVRELRCRVPMSAIATFAAGELSDEDVCSSDPTPAIRFAGRTDRHVPMDGGESCVTLSTVPVRSSAAMDEGWRARNVTSSESENWVDRPGEGTCTIWRGEASYVRCILDGGHFLPGDEDSMDPGCLGGSRTPNDFPVGETTVRFFLEEGRTLRSE